MSSLKNALTIEKLTKKFQSPFDLVNYAISLAENIVKTGRNSQVSTTVQNPAYWVLLEIYEGRDYFSDIVEKEKVPEDSKEALAKRVLENKKA